MNEKKVFLPDINKKSLSILLAAVLGVLLICISGFTSSFSKNNNISANTELESYIKNMENRLCKTVSQIDGAGKTQVFITVENTFETVYASNANIDESGDLNKTSKTTQKQLAYSSSGTGGETPVIVKQKCPEICGVLVVCEGGSVPEIRQEIIKSVSTAVGISTNKIYVTGGKH